MVRLAGIAGHIMGPRVPKSGRKACPAPWLLSQRSDHEEGHVKQVFQSFDDGTTAVIDVPAPQVSPGHVLIRTEASIISAGTERMLVEFGQANLLQKARQQPEKVRQVLDKVLTDGVAPTLQAVRSKLSQPIPLGYANAGRVVAVGPDVTDLAPGDRVASNGAHAEVVSVPRNLVVKVPHRTEGEFVPPEEAAFASLGAIALQGVRLTQPTLGERFVVTGLGLIGLLAIQILRAHGCQVLGIDFDRRRLDLAESFGATTVDLSAGADPVSAAEAFTHGDGADGVLIAASTNSADPVRQGAQMCRKRGRIVLVGVTGLELDRSEFYEKELSFQVSCSYGPGRYDPDYEEAGHDYPLGFVRWTAGRNFHAFLQLVADGKVQLEPITTHEFDISKAATAYETLTGAPDALGVRLSYPVDDHDHQGILGRHITNATASTRSPAGRGHVAVIGAGNYTRQVLLPALKKTPATLDTILSLGGASAALAAREFGFARASTDIDAVLADDLVDTVIITTRHDTHAELTIRALEAGKHVFVEKPLAITRDELDQVWETYERLASSGTVPLLMVGFNRRFAPLTVAVKRLVDSVAQPKAFVATVNAGTIPTDHWTQDPQVGGGRIIGEACHFIDLLRHLVGHRIVGTSSTFLDAPTPDTATIQFRFEDGSIGTIHYLANGNKRFPKERVEVFAAGRVLQLDNFRRLQGHGWTDFKRQRLRSQDKGHHAGVAAFIDAVLGRAETPIAAAELFEVSSASIEAARG